MLKASKTVNGTKRVRLGHKAYRQKRNVVVSAAVRQQTSEIQKKRIKDAPKNSEGKVIQGYRYKQLISTYKANGLTPKIDKGTTNHSSGRPLFQKDPLIYKTIITLLKQGLPHLTVCRYVGVDSSTFNKWLLIGSQGVYPNYTKFHRDVCKAEAIAEQRLLHNLKKHEITDWRVSSWQLERRWPENWGKRDGNRARVEVHATVNVNRKEELSRTVLMDENAKELARKMIDNVPDVTREAVDVEFKEE